MIVDYRRLGRRICITLRRLVLFLGTERTRPGLVGLGLTFRYLFISIELYVGVDFWLISMLSSSLPLSGFFLAVFLPFKGV